MLKITNLRKDYGKFTAVHKSNFQVDEGEIVAIIGPNGAGKTTTLKMICSLLKPSAGSIEFKGFDYKKDIEKIKQLIGFVPEESAIYEDMTAKEYLLFFSDLYKIPRKTALKKIKSLLKELEMNYPDRQLGNMSKGMKRKVLIARSLINDPEILIYDEPASGLDPHTTNFILNYILDLKKKNKTIIFTAHNLHQVEFVCDRVIIMDKGKIKLDDYVKNVKKLFGESKYNIKYLDENILVEKLFESLKDMNSFMSTLFKENKKIVELNVKEKSLEEIFLKLTKQKSDK